MSEVTYGERELKRWLGAIRDKAHACSQLITDHKLDDADREAMSIFEMAYDVAPCRREGCLVAWPDSTCAPPTGSERRYTLEVDAVESWLFAVPGSPMKSTWLRVRSANSAPSIASSRSTK